MQRKTDDYKDQSIPLALKGLGADRERGLTSSGCALAAADIRSDTTGGAPSPTKCPSC